MARKDFMILDEIVDNLNVEFEKLEEFNALDWSELDMTAQENLTEHEYHRWQRLLNWWVTKC